ncbi:hypothetical protein ABZV14_35230 [Streptosporangium canum]|uniref:hypothetical protein n=1 Tax=Streptosporangium canum TaxID=324952 RepID=UPI0033A8F18A
MTPEELVGLAIEVAEEGMAAGEVLIGAVVVMGEDVDVAPLVAINRSATASTHRLRLTPAAINPARSSADFYSTFVSRRTARLTIHGRRLLIDRIMTGRCRVGGAGVLAVTAHPAPAVGRSPPGPARPPC